MKPHYPIPAFSRPAMMAFSLLAFWTYVGLWCAAVYITVEGWPL